MAFRQSGCRTVTITATTKDGSNISASYTITVVYQYQKITSSVEKVSVELQTSWDTMAAEKLPASVTISDAKGNTAQAAVRWSCPDYDGSKAGSYEATGTVTLPDGWTGTIPALKVTVEVTGEKP